MGQVDGPKALWENMACQELITDHNHAKPQPVYETIDQFANFDVLFYRYF